MTIAQINLRQSLNATLMVDTFNKLAGLCFFLWPDPTFEGMQSVQFVIGNNVRKYNAKLKLLAKQFVDEVNQFCNVTDTKNCSNNGQAKYLLSS